MLESLVVLAVVVIDLLTKTYGSQWLMTLPNQTYVLIEGIFQLTYVENRGAAFGLLQDHNARWFFIAITLFACVAMVVFLVRERKNLHFLMRLSIALVFAGAIGNLIDRAFLGYVRDLFYLICIDFPVFNIADSAVTVGGALLVVDLLFLKGKAYLTDMDARLSNKRTK